MNSRRSPRSAYKQPLLSDPPPQPPLPLPAMPAASTYRARSPSSSSAASAASTSSVSSILQSTPTSKTMPLRTPTGHPSPGYQGYFDPYTTSSSHLPQHQQQHPQVQPTTTAQIVAAQAAMQASAAAAAKKRAPTMASIPSPKSPGLASSTIMSSAAGAAANAVMPRSALEKHFDNMSSSQVNLGNISANSSTTTITPRDLIQASPSTTNSTPTTASLTNNTPGPSSSTPTLSPAHQTSPTATKKESSSKMNKLFSSRSNDLKHAIKPPPSPSKIPHSIISNPIPRITGSSSERKASFSDKFNPSSSTLTLVGAATATGSGVGVGVNIGGDVFNYAPPQAPYASSIYSSSPPSKESHSRTHFLRVRKDKDTVALSSASSNSKSVSADGSSIYSFIPSSPSSSVFITSHHSKSSSKGEDSGGGLGGGGVGGSGVDKYTHHHKKDAKDKYHHNLDDPNSLGSPEDWLFVRRAITALFEGDPLRTPVEDMNRFVSAHIRRCKYNNTPLRVLLGDVTDILDAGMLSLDPTLQGLEDDKLLVGRLVELWGFVWSGVLPYWEAVMLPLRGEWRRHGGEWIGGIEGGDSSEDLGRVLDTRRMALVSFRENVVLPLHPRLRIVFSRLQLDFSSDLPNVTENVARVLQCISVLASILSADEDQQKIDELAKTLKHNWLSRGRAGRNRRGFVPQKTRVVGAV